jgi:transposase
LALGVCNRALLLAAAFTLTLGRFCTNFYSDANIYLYDKRQTGVAKAIKDMCRTTRKHYSAEEKICIVLDWLRGEETIAELFR